MHKIIARNGFKERKKCIKCKERICLEVLDLRKISLINTKNVLIMMSLFCFITTGTFKQEKQKHYLTVLVFGLSK